MNIAFYNAALGASQQQKRLDVVSNNIANVNTEGYRLQNPTFVDLLYSNIHDTADAQTDLTVGAGARVEKTDIDFTQSVPVQTDGQFDFAIKGEGFFAVYDTATGDIKYTRKGNFGMSEYGTNIFYLTTDTGEFVLNSQGQAIRVTGELNENIDVGVYDFTNYQGMLAIGDEFYMPVGKNGQPYLNEDADVMRGFLERSNVFLGEEMATVIKAQRAYQAELRMITTADQIEQTINSLR